MARTPDNHTVLPLFCDDLIASCVDMTPACFGAYMRLLCYAWTRGGLPNSESACQRIAGGMDSGDWDAIRSRLVLIDEGTPAERLTHQRLELERAAVAENREKRSEAGKKGNQRRWGSQNDRKAIANASQTASQNDRKAIANGIANASQKHRSPSPSPSLPSSSLREEEQQQQQPREAGSSSAMPQEADGWADVPGEWGRLREAWNATPGVQPWQSLEFARTDLLVARLSDPNWLRIYPDALAKLPACRWFDDPVTLRQFLGETFAADVLCGTYDREKTRGKTHAASAPRRGSL